LGKLLPMRGAGDRYTEFTCAPWKPGGIL